MAPKTKNLFKGKDTGKRSRVTGLGSTSGYFSEATPLTKDQTIRKRILQEQRTIYPSRWINLDTINTLGIAESVQLLTSRLNLWEFLCDEVPTYRKLTIEFLSSFEFDRGTRIMSFNLGGRHWELTAVELMRTLGFRTDNVTEMADSISYRSDMTLPNFKKLIIKLGSLNFQRAKTIVHPTLRYIQRVLAYTLFGRGETTSVIRADELFYLYCMLRRNEEEMHFMPHLGYFLAKHLYYVATQTQPNGVITCGGIITKIAMRYRIDTGTDVVDGPTNLDLPGLTQMQLIRWHDYDYWVTCGPDDVEYKLPLEHPIDPADQDTWKPVDEPNNVSDDEQEGQQPPQHQPEPQQQPAPAPVPAGPSNQDLMNYMIGLSTTMNEMRIHFDKRIDEVERDVYAARQYAQQTYFHLNPDAEEVPQTPPAEKRRGRARERANAEAQPQDQHMEVDDEGVNEE